MTMDNFLRFLQQLLTMADPADPDLVEKAENALRTLVEAQKQLEAEGKATTFSPQYAELVAQLEKAVAAVKAGQGVRVSEQRKKELEEQFPDKEESGENVAADGKRVLSAEEKAWCDEIGLWPELARVWMSRI